MGECTSELAGHTRVEDEVHCGVDVYQEVHHVVYNQHLEPEMVELMDGDDMKYAISFVYTYSSTFIILLYYILTCLIMN